jgi:hypothetical protein
VFSKEDRDERHGFESLSLDGVMQAPGAPDEDTRGGFEHGGWAVPYADADSGRIAAESMANTGALLLGRRSYEGLLAAWNQRGGPFKDILNNTPSGYELRQPVYPPASTRVQGARLGFPLGEGMPRGGGRPFESVRIRVRIRARHFG